MKLRKKLFRFSACLITVLFTFDTICWSAPGLSAAGGDFPENLNHLQVSIPSDMGEVRAFYRAPGSARFVVHIQDAHGNYEAQQNIRNLLAHLSDRYRFNLVFKEGANVKLDPSLFHFFEDRALDLKVADLLMRHGEFSGAEMFLLEKSVASKEAPVEMLGMENAEIYSRDFTLFREVAGNREAVLGFTEQMKLSAELLESRVFSKELREFVREWKKSSREDSGIGRFVETLAQRALSLLSLDLKDPRYQDSYEAILRILRLKELEASLDFKKIQDEKTALIGFLTGKVDPELLEGLSAFGRQEPNGAKVGVELPRLLFEKICAQAANHGLDFRKYPEFVRYAEYRIFQSEIEAEKLFREMESVTEKILETLARTQEEKALLDLTRDLGFFEKLLTLELSRPEFSKVLERGNDLSPEELLKRMRAFSEVRLDLPSQADLDGFYQKSMEFYRLARAREKFFLEKMVNEMTRRGQSLSVMVTGGFHAEGIETALREMGYSYLSVCPRIGQVGDSHELYLRAMLGNTTILDRAQLDAISQLLPEEEQGVMAQNPGFLLHRQVVVAQAVEAIAQAASLGGAAKYRGIAPDELTELIERLKPAGRDVSADPWLNQIIGEVRFVLREHLQGVDWGDYVKGRLERWIASAQRELDSARGRHEAELAKLRDRERMASFSQAEATRLKDETARWASEIARRTEQAGRVSELLSTPQNLLNGASQILRDTARRPDQQIAYFQPSPEDRARMFRFYDEADRADFLVAFETEEGIFILDGLPQHLEGMDLKGERLMRALLVNAGAERFLAARGVDPELAHLIAEDLERIVLMSPEEIHGGISFDLPQLSQENSPLDQAIIEFGRKPLAASEEVAAVPGPAAASPADAGESASATVSAEVPEGEVKTFSDFEGLFEYLRQFLPVETIPGLTAQFIRGGDVFEVGKNVLVMKEGDWYLTVLKNEENFWEIRVIHDTGGLAQNFISLSAGEIRSTPMEIVSNKVVTGETLTLQIKIRIRVSSDRLDAMRTVFQRGEIPGGKPPFEKLFSVTPVPGTEQKEFLIEVTRQGEISAADVSGEPESPAESGEPAAPAESAAPAARVGYAKKGITDEQVLQAYQASIDHVGTPLWDESDQLNGLPTVNELSQTLGIVSQSLKDRLKSRFERNESPLGYLSFRLTRNDPGALTMIQNWLVAYNRVNPGNPIAIPDNNLPTYVRRLFEIYLTTMQWMRDETSPAPDRATVMILNQLFEFVGIPLVKVPEIPSPAAAAEPEEPAAPVPAVPAVPERPAGAPSVPTIPVVIAAPAKPAAPPAPAARAKAAIPSKGVTDGQIIDAFRQLLENIDHVRIPAWEASGILRGIPSFREIAEVVGCKTGEVKSRWEHLRAKNKVPFGYLPVDSEPAVSEIANVIAAYNQGANEDGRILSSPEELFGTYLAAVDFLQGNEAAVLESKKITELNNLFRFLGIPLMELPEGVLRLAETEEAGEPAAPEEPASPVPATSAGSAHPEAPPVPAALVESAGPSAQPPVPGARGDEAAAKKPAARGITKGQIIQAYRRLLGRIDHHDILVWNASNNWSGIPAFRDIAQVLDGGDESRVKTSDIQRRWKGAKDRQEEPFNYLPTGSDQTVFELTTVIVTYNQKVKAAGDETEARTVQSSPEELIGEYQKAVSLLRGEGEEQPSREVIGELNCLFGFIGIPVLELPGEALAAPSAPEAPSGPEAPAEPGVPAGPSATPTEPVTAVSKAKGISDEQFVEAYRELIDHAVRPLWNESGETQGLPSANQLGKKLNITPQSVRNRLQNRRERGLRPLSTLSLRLAEDTGAQAMIRDWLEAYNRANPENQIAIPNGNLDRYAADLFSAYWETAKWMADRNLPEPEHDEVEVLNRLFDWVGIPLLDLPETKSASVRIEQTIEGVMGDADVNLRDWDAFVQLVSEGSGQPGEMVLAHERIQSIYRGLIERGNAAVEAAVTEVHTTGMTLKNWPDIVQTVSRSSGQPADFVLRNEQMQRISQGMIKTAERVYRNFSELEETLETMMTVTGLSMDQILEDRKVQALYLTLLSKTLRSVVEDSLVHKYAWRDADWDSAQVELLANSLFAKVPQPMLEQRIRALNLSKVFTEGIAAVRREVKGEPRSSGVPEPETPETRQAHLQQIFNHLVPRLQHAVDSIVELENLLGQPHNGNGAGVLGLLGIAQKDLAHASLEQAAGSIRSARRSTEGGRRREGAGMKGSEGAHELAARTRERAVQADVAWSILSDPELLRIYFRLYPARWDVELLSRLLDAGQLDEFFPDAQAASPHETYPDYFDVLGIEISRSPEEVWEWDEGEEAWKVRSTFLRSVNFGEIQKAIRALPSRRETRWGLIRDDFGGRFRTALGLQHVMAEWAEVYVPKPERPAEASSLGLPQEVVEYLQVQERSAQAVLQVALSHEQGGITEGVLYLPGNAEVLRWFFDQIGVRSEEHRAVSGEVLAFNADVNFSRFSEALGISAQSPESNIPLILFDAVLNIKGADVAEMAAKIANAMNPGDLVVAVRQNGGKHPVIDKLLIEARQRNVRVKTISQELIDPAAIGSLVKAFSVQPVSISPWKEGEDLELDFDGTKIKLNRKTLLSHGVDPLQLVGLIRQLADNPEERKERFLKAGFELQTDGSWVVGSGFVQLIQRIYAEAGAQAAIRSAA